MISDILVATHNPDKLKELQELLNNLKVRLHFLDELPQFLPSEENGKTIYENAMQKALEAAKYSGLLTLADDTGLFIEELNGAPGILSARFAGNSCSYSDNRKKVLNLLQGVENRKAYFETVVALALPDGIVAVLGGKLEGEITTEELGDNGFGYDSIFAVGDKTYAEMDSEQKNKISHRALAMKAIIPILEKVIID
ncbi:MAG: RdgB/HAM1 family non-canonical purine NTP pyrophosphatase [Candidatus Cloacimonetes bacterium]|jgi:XTP/dITP diphosphohydrolase|nr:RdgB/HAM1 family non-canonical purine NTP pyrophosphatase [Candidatus Cloacimonas sp.]MDD2249701.1 RdgB/HAM1 family non-canonical purine NTP pyrophosphatase [Candidatus Cloacimonadota bacterium]MCK9164222.1 RdgB/HAM1 family non-canonical purine NTP pyrophosphatase [Candidatus Cloacimonas sp.]MDD3733672.1 RdgB/HAM1 family non-canonical purine NTP pyrophosphatase [Candidatus Cloacimonadota bacterium]HPN26265.1 RdgB/HAM1 family non-canonical purine NTP pyrophosphatase [Candidatus Cloacimonas sp